MILQKIVFPDSGVLENEMYYRAETGISVIGEENVIKTNSYFGNIGFDTYFNAFSLKKWKKYTNISNVSLALVLKGKMRVTLLSLELDGCCRNVEKTVLYSKIAESREKKAFEFLYPETVSGESVSFFITPLESDCEIYGGAYLSDIEKENVKEINISLAICTFRREDFIRRNMKMLEDKIFNNKNSPACNHIEVFISDNGNTLLPEEFSSPHIHISPNKNSGGAGGFSRSAINAVNCESFKATHVVVMDDDIEFTAECIERLFVFISVLKPEYENSMLGGANLRLDSKNMQHGAGETVSVDGITYNKINYDMNNLVDVLRNEREENINFFAWWFCAVPAGVFREKGYALPFFFQFDDIEFGLRSPECPKITLNGVCCWHLGFHKKVSGTKHYYSFRNRCTAFSLHFDFTKKQLKKALKHECSRRIFKYDYNTADLIILAGHHFLNGLEWLKDQDPVELNAEISTYADTLSDVSELPMHFDPRNLIINDYSEGNGIKKLIRKLTLNGWFLPANREVTVEIEDPPVKNLYRVRRAIKYDVNSGKGIVVEKDTKRAISIIKQYIKLTKRINREFDKTVKNNREIAKNVSSEEFWRNYLNF